MIQSPPPQADARDITYVPSHQCREGIREHPRNAAAGDTALYTLGTDVLDLASALPSDVTVQGPDSIGD